MGILIVIAAAFAKLILGSFEGGARSREQMIATALAQEGLEVLKAIATDGVRLLPDGTYGIGEKEGTYVLMALADAHGKFVREVTITTVHREDDGTFVPSEGDDSGVRKLVTSKVTWSLPGGRARSVRLESLLTDWRHPRWLTDLTPQFQSGSFHAVSLAEAGDGGVQLQSVDLAHPEEFLTVPLPTGAVVRDIEFDSIADRLYIITDDNGKKPEFFVYDMSNVSRGALPLIGSVELESGGIGFALGEQYAYTLTMHEDREVRVVRLRDLKLVSILNIADAAFPRDITVDEERQRAYVLTTKEAFHAPTVALVPPETVAFSERSERERTLLQRLLGVEEVFAQGKGKGGGGGGGGKGGGTKKGKKSQGDLRLEGALGEKLYILDIAQPEISKTKFVGELRLRGGKRIMVQGGVGYVLKNDPLPSMEVIDLEGKKSLGSCPLAEEQDVEDMVLMGSRLFTVHRAGPGYEFLEQELNLEDPLDCAALKRTARRQTHFPTDARMLSIVPEKNLAFIVSGQGANALSVIDLEDERAPLRSLKTFQGVCDSIATVGSYLFTGCRKSSEESTVTLFTTHFVWGTYTSKPFDAGSLVTWKRMSWHVQGEGSVSFRLRSATTLEELHTAAWVGPDGTSGSTYTKSEGEPIVLAQDAGSRFLQWKAYFRGDGTAAPVLEDVTLTYE